MSNFSIQVNLSSIPTATRAIATTTNSPFFFIRSILVHLHHNGVIGNENERQNKLSNKREKLKGAAKNI